MLKFGLIVVVVYFCLFGLTKMYFNGLGDLDKFAYAYGVRSRWQNLWLIILGILRLAAIVFGVIAAILFVVEVF